MTIKNLFDLCVAMNENIYSLAFMRTHDLILIADCNYQIIDANPASCYTLGYNKEELLNLNISQVFADPKDGDQFVRDICKSPNSIDQRDYEWIAQDKRRFPVIIDAEKLDENTDIIMVVAKDVTNYKKEKENHFTKKEMMVLGKMAQNVAHDLKNPLNNIFLGLHQFRTVLPEDNEEINFYLDFLEKNSRRIHELINSKLSQQSVLNLQKEELNLNDLVNEAAKKAEEKIKLSNILLNLDLSEQPLRYWADKDKMLMALDNIIVNAIESVSEDDGIIYIKTEQKKGKSAVVISDNGHGISATDMRNIYDPNFSTKSRKMGLGLVNTEQILNAHEVEMEVQSETGKGSTFTLYF